MKNKEEAIDALEAVFAVLGEVFSSDDSDDEPKTNKQPEKTTPTKTCDDESAELLYNLYAAYMRAGFSEKRAFDLIAIIASEAARTGGRP